MMERMVVGFGVLKSYYWLIGCILSNGNLKTTYIDRKYLIMTVVLKNLLFLLSNAPAR